MQYQKLIFILALFVLGLGACKDDPCDNLDCGPNGTCNSDTGLCECDPNWAGVTCNTLSPLGYRAQFVGTYSVIETCGTGNDAYDIAISESSTADNAIIINNLFNWGENISATISQNSLDIPNQIADGVTFVGSGNLDGDVLTFTFTVASNGQSDNCQSTATRK